MLLIETDSFLDSHTPDRPMDSAGKQGGEPYLKVE